jgi:hypothetical protein
MHSDQGHTEDFFLEGVLLKDFFGGGGLKKSKNAYKIYLYPFLLRFYESNKKFRGGGQTPLTPPPFGYSLDGDRIKCVTMDVQINIWDLPRTEEQAIIFLQDKRLLPKTKQCVNGDTITLYSYEKQYLWNCKT